MSRRGALLLPVAALAVHQLRYLLAYGPHTGAELAEQGHAYLHTLTPWIVLACASGFGAWLGGAARARRAPEPVAMARIWGFAAAGLIAIYAGQELLEGALAGGHASGLAAVLGSGGWLAIPSAVLVAALLALVLRGAQEVLLRLARDRAKPPRPVAARRPRTFLAPPRAPLATAAAGRAPPRAAAGHTV